ncbi:MAG: hypothetical protein M1396_05020 [Chloroflexi bacterium]|nr:hypothetical protein [Chloroflexota bacterium]
MLPSRHVVYGAMSAVVLAPFLRKRALLFWGSSVLIDIDHYFWFAFKREDWNPRNALDFFQNVRAGAIDLNGQDARPLHGPAIVAVLGALSLHWRVLRPIFLGVLFHSLLDAYSERRLNAFLPLRWRYAKGK